MGFGRFFNSSVLIAAAVQPLVREIPNGNHTFVAWYKAAGVFRQKVSVTSDRGATVEFFVPHGEEPAPKVEARR